MKSGYKKSGVDRNDFRNSKIEDTSTPALTKHKDKKMFCGGKPGRIHQIIVMKSSDIKNRFIARSSDDKLVLGNKTYLKCCSVCGRELDVYHGFDEKPDWLIQHLDDQKNI